MPVVPRDLLWPSPYLLPGTSGQRYFLGWQDTRKDGSDRSRPKRGEDQRKPAAWCTTHELNASGLTVNSADKLSIPTRRETSMILRPHR